MATARDIVERAFRKIGVVASDEAMTADQADNGLDALNMMMNAWVLDGIDVAHIDLQLADTFTMEPRFHEGCVYLLAERLGPDYAAPLSFNTARFKQQLAAAFLVVPNTKFDAALLRRVGRSRWTV